MAELLLLLGRLLLGFVFAAAAVGKLADRSGSRQALHDFGVPDAVVPSLAAGLPAAEVAVAGALIVPATAWVGALGALALLLCFAAAIAVNVRHGRTSSCHCFGRLHSAPTGWSTLARTTALAVLAGLFAAALRETAGPSPLAWTASLSPAGATALVLGVGLVAILLGAGALSVHLLAENERLGARVDALEARLRVSGDHASSGQPAGLAVGAPAPPFTLDDLDGRPISLDELRRQGRPIIVVFSDHNCGPCRALQPQLAAWQHDHAATLTLIVVSRGTLAPDRGDVSRSGEPTLLLQPDRDVADAYHATATPTAVLIRPDGTIGSTPALGAHAIADLVASATADSGAGRPPGLRVLPQPDPFVPDREVLPASAPT
jgi:peroxiredoxin